MCLLWLNFGFLFMFFTGHKSKDICMSWYPEQLFTFVLFFHHNSEILPITWPCLWVTCCCCHVALSPWVELSWRITKQTDHTASGAQLVSGFPVMGTVHILLVYEKFLQHKYAPYGHGHAWDILILKNYSLSIWNPILTGHPVSYLAILPTAWAGGNASTPLSTHTWWSNELRKLSYTSKMYICWWGGSFVHPRKYVVTL